MEDTVDQACNVLANGGVILYPTDTVYGLGADATNERAVAMVNTIKQRTHAKAQLILAADVAMAERYGSFNDIAKKLAQTFWPGPLTILVPKKDILPDVVTAGSDMIGIRVPNHTFCIDVVKALGKPITSTSANVSGQPQAQTLDGILKDLAEHKDKIALVIEEKKVQVSLVPSTLVKVEGNTVVVVREGAIPRAAIETINMY